MTARRSPLIAIFPEASFGAALNCVGIAQQLAKQGATPVFLTHGGFHGVFADYGFDEHRIPGEPDLTADETQSYWQDFLSHHLPHFNLPPQEQLTTYVAPVWQAIVDGAMAVEVGLQSLLARLKPDAVVIDNVIMFPAIANAGVPWVRVVSCAETELPDPRVPPYLSGLASGADPAAFTAAYRAATAPAHDAYNAFRTQHGLPPLAEGLFMEPSPHLNLLLAPGITRHTRATPLDPARFTCLDGCVRQEAPYTPPAFPRDTGPLVYVSFGSLGAMDTAFFGRLLDVFATLPARFLVNVGAGIDAYSNVPDNVHLQDWFPQPSVVAQCDLFIHHGGNNSFCEALFHGVPSLILPYCWDGHDNAARAAETGVGQALHRWDMTDAALARAITDLLGDSAMRDRLRANARQMQQADHVALAARRILGVLPA